MEQVRDVPVLQSLQDHVIHRCGACGHIVLVQEDPLQDPQRRLAHAAADRS